MALKRGDYVAKLGGDYIFKGRVAAVFDKLDGEGVQRVVVQNGDGVLMIMNPGQLCKYSDKVQVENLIASMLSTIERDYCDRIGESSKTFLSVTGEHYVEILSIFDVDATQDGRLFSRTRKAHDTPAEAIAAALTNFRHYEHCCRSTNPPGYVPRLYWRIKPEIDQFEGKWKVYMRCLLSAKPPLDPQSLSLLLSKRSSPSTSVSSP